MGAQHCPLGLHALWGLSAAGLVAVPAPAPQLGALASCRCVLLGRQRGVPGGGAFRHCGERLSSGASPFLASRLPGGMGPPPACCGRGCASKGVQYCPLGSWRGGWSSTVTRGVGCRALPLPRPPALWAGCRGLLSTCCGCGRAGVGASHCPLGLRALWGLRAAGLVGGRPRGGWPAIVVRGVRCQALSLPRPPVLWGGQPGFRDPCVPDAVGVGVEIQHQSHSVRPCGPALCAVGVAEGHPRGGCHSPL